MSRYCQSAIGHPVPLRVLCIIPKVSNKDLMKRFAYRSIVKIWAISGGFLLVRFWLRPYEPNSRWRLTMANLLRKQLFIYYSLSTNISRNTHLRLHKEQIPKNPAYQEKHRLVHACHKKFELLLA